MKSNYQLNIMEYSNKPHIIIGAGGHASVLIDALKYFKVNLIGYVALEKSETSFIEHSYLGDDNFVLNYRPEEVVLINGIGSLPDYNIRWNISKKFRDLKYEFSQVIHPSVILSQNTQIDSGVQIMANSVIQTGVKLGHDTIINTSCSIDHDCNIYKNCHIGPGTICSGGVKIKENVHVGTGSTIIQNINIGAGSIIAAGSIIHKDIPKHTKYLRDNHE